MADGAVRVTAPVSVVDSGSGFFLVDRSMGELLLGASLGVSVGCSVGCSGVGSSGGGGEPAGSVVLDDGPGAGSSGALAGLLEVFSVWFNWASWNKKSG